MPFPLRFPLAFDGKLLGQVLRIFTDTIAANYRKRQADRGIADGQCGAITVIQRGADLASRQTAVDMPPPIPPRHGVREDAHDLAEQLPVEREREAQGEGHREHELSDRDIRQNVVHQVQGALAHPPAEAARAHRSCFARERHGVVLAAGIAVQVGKTSPQNPAVHERVQLVCHKLGQRLAAGLVGPLLLEGQKVLLQHLVEGSLFRLPARVDRAR